MDQLAASPVTNDYALLLSKILRSAKNVGNKVDLPVLGGVGDMLLGKAPEEVENWAYGNSPINMPPEGTGARIPQVKPNRKEGLADALLAAPTGGMGGVGHAMITAGGDPRLLLLRRTGTDQILRDVNRGKVERASYAITEDPSFLDADQFGPHLLLPHPRSLDPAKNPNTQLFNTDAWSGDLSGGPFGDVRFSGQDLKSLMDGGVPIDASVVASSSPRFRSFREFEKSPVGAKRLMNDQREAVDPLRYEDDIAKHYESILSKNFSDVQTRAFIKQLRSGIHGFEEPMYAELKDVGSLPFNKDHFQGMYVDPNFVDDFKSFSKMIKNKTGIPIMKYDAYDDAANRVMRYQKKAKF